MIIALIQVASPPEETTTARRSRVGRIVEEAAGADLVVLPELWPSGYFAFDDYATEAEGLDGATVRAGQEWARQLGCYVHLGSVLERDCKGRIFNTAILLSPQGSVVHTYRKIHVFGHESQEATLLSSGHDAVVAQSDFGAVASTTCYDLRFPELWRHLVDNGAKIVITPAAWPATRLSHWRLFTSCRAVEEQIFLVAVNAVGTQGDDVALGGNSRVVDPWGEVIVEAGTDEGITFAEIDLRIVDQVRAEFPVLADRRILSAGAGSPLVSSVQS